MGEADGQTFIFEESGVIGFLQAVYLCEYDALKRAQGAIHHKALERRVPLSLERLDIWSTMGLHRSVDHAAKAQEMLRTSLDSAAIPKTR